MSLLALVDDDAPSLPRPRTTQLLSYGWVGRQYGTFVDRTPPVTIDPAALGWIGQPLKVTERLQLQPADLRWIGRVLQFSGTTQLLPHGLPGRRYGAFSSRAPQTIIPIEPAELAWVGEFLGGLDFLDPANLTWVGQQVIVRVRAITTQLTPHGLPGPRYGLFVNRAPIFALDPAGLTWAGQQLVVNERLTIPLDPADLAWIPQDLTVREPIQIQLDPVTLTWQGQDLVANAHDLVAVDPADLAWLGQALNINARTQVAVSPADLTWLGRALAINARTQLPLAPANLTWLGQALPLLGQPIILSLSPADLTWTGQPLIANGKVRLVTDPAALAWQGQPLIPNAQSALVLEPADLALLGQGLTIATPVRIVMAPADLQWVGQQLALNDELRLVLLPAALTWTGQNLVVGGTLALARVVFLVPTVRATFLVPAAGGGSLLGSLPKQPDETFPIVADFTARLAAGEVLVSQVVTARNLTVPGDSTGSLLIDPAVAGSLASVRLKAAGTVNQDNRVQMRVITSLGNSHEVEIDVRIRALLRLGSVPKQPSESFPVALDFARRLETGEPLIGTPTATARDLSDDTDSTVALLSQAQIIGTLAQVRVGAGVDGENHRVQLRVVTSLGNTYEAELDIRIRET